MFINADQLASQCADTFIAPLSITQSAQFLQSALPDLAGPSSSSGDAGSCGGCYIVADVAGLVWYSEVFVILIPPVVELVRLIFAR